MSFKWLSISIKDGQWNSYTEIVFAFIVRSFRILMLTDLHLHFHLAYL